jgi:RNA polymerase sigma factor (sigma-70 family)
MRDPHPEIPDSLPAREGLERYYPSLYRFLVRSLRGVHHTHARDLVQDVFLRFLALPQREKVRQPQAYLIRIASNLIKEYRLRERRTPVVFDSELAEGQAEGEGAEAWRDAVQDGLGLRQQIEQVLLSMPPTQRAVALLWTRDGLSAAEIAARVGFTPQTTQKYLGQRR